jgi:signal transduction histidine kinase/CheY-like chemotaxis protein
MPVSVGRRQPRVRWTRENNETSPLTASYCAVSVWRSLVRRDIQFARLVCRVYNPSRTRLRGITLDALTTATAALASARSLERVIELVKDCARALTHADGVTFILREHDQCFYAEEEAIEPLWKGRRFPIPSCISGWAMLHREAAVIPDIYADPRIPHDVYRPTFVKSLVMVPVRREDPVAAIGIYWAERHTPMDQDVATLQTLADAAALALHNIELDAELRRSLARERTAREKAEAVNKMKDEFLATLSHELRTPLHLIQNWVWQLKAAKSPKTVQKALDVIDKNVALHSRLTEDLLDVARAASGRLSIRPRLVDLNATCATVVGVLHPAAQAKKVLLKFEKGRPSYISADAERLSQILWNVIDNAIKFTPPDGRITVKTVRASRHACIRVEDTGIGIDPEFLPTMFDRFKQADASTTRRFSGLGLGLNIVRELMRLHGGTVEATSAGKDRGTQITLQFPLPAVLDEPGAWLRKRAGIEPKEARLDGLSVLVVDDDPEVLHVLSELLHQYGAKVETAPSADEAIAILRARVPNVLIADLAMPEKDGFELLRAIRAMQTPAKHVAAAVLSAYQAADQGAKASETGYQIYLEKPIPPLELINRIADLAEQKTL